MTSEEDPVKMAGQEDNTVRMAGYLDKRGKMKLVSTWKRYWFVLKDQLLLYYKSELECLNLSACRGSLNMGLVSCVRPGAHRGPPVTGTQGYTIEVVTRTQVVVLRTRDRGLQEQWLKVLLESVALPNISSPIKIGGGPVHFRYSLDSLHLETEDKETQKHLPRHTTVTRNDSLLRRIKRMGGRSYGGSLDTILKHQPSHQVQQQRSPHQPKLPRIRAVDRMLGLELAEDHENADDREERQCLNSHGHTGVLIHKTQCTNLVDEEQCLNDSTNLLSEDDIWKPDNGEEIKCTDNSPLRPVAIALGSQEMKEINCTSINYESNQEASDKSQDYERYNAMSIEEAKKWTTNFLESKKCVSFLESAREILVENKLYEKTEDMHEVDKHEIGNKAYEKINHNEEDKEYDSEEELSNLSQVHRVPHDEKAYEIVSVNTDAEEQIQKDTEDTGDKEEDDYYSSYDKVSLIHLLSDRHNCSSPEPDLPPRPSVGSIDSSKSQLKHEATKTEDEEADYSIYYESTESFNTSTSSSQVLSSGGDGTPRITGSKLHDGIKLMKSKSPSKESITPDDASNNSKKKRKTSFLRRMLKHYRKKPQSNSETLVTSDNYRSSDEPEYETVYSFPVLKHDDTEGERPLPAARSNSTKTTDKQVHKEKWYGKKSLLTEQTMLELKMKLKVRDDVAPFASQNNGYKCISSDEVSEKKPIPTPRPNKQNSEQDNKGHVDEATRYHCNDSISRVNKPPSLPPRRVARPHSPWHDVPKNNSPIYGNFQDLGLTVGVKEESKIKETSEPTINKHSTPQAGEWVQEFQGDYLGTPCGFVYIQNKWKAVEKSCEWHHDQQESKGKLLFQASPQKDMFPKKCINAEVKEKHVRGASSDNSGSGTVNDEHETGVVLVASTCSSDSYSDVHKEHLSAETIIKSLNSQTEKVTDSVSGSINTSYKEGDNEVNYVEDKTEKVNNVELLHSADTELKMRSMETKHHDTCGDIILNYSNANHNILNKNMMHHKDQSDDKIITPRKFQSGSVSMCNKHEVFLEGNKNCQVAVKCEDEGVSSSQHHNESNMKGVKEETKDKECTINNDTVCISTDSSAQQETKTLFDTVYNQNNVTSRITNDILSRTLQRAEAGVCEDIIPHLNRHSDELNLLLAQLAEITSAPLLPQGSATSLVDIPKSRKPKDQIDEPSQLGPTQPKSFVLGPIRRRRHSDPDYDVPRPHGSLLPLLSSHSSDQSQSGQESDVIEATHFFGEADLTSNSACSSLSLRHSVISEVDDQSDMSYYVSMAPDSLEVPLSRDMEGNT